MNKIVSRFYVTPDRKAIAHLPRELLPSGQACEASGSESLHLREWAGDAVALGAKGLPADNSLVG